ncbi:MAG: protein-export chaperone SecB [Alphaproteobacteria bacterium]|nr:protein-export chaperone SecB [Alphaproteobacteria bacterium]
MADQAPQFPITVNAQYTKDFSFENPNAPQSLVNKGTPPNVEVNINVEARPVSEDSYEVALKVSASAKSEEATAFVVELTYACIMTLNGFSDDQIQPVLMIEGPRLLFPFARQIIADATREGGFPPLLINPIDFAAMYQQNMMQQQGQGEAAGNA